MCTISKPFTLKKLIRHNFKYLVSNRRMFVIRASTLVCTQPISRNIGVVFSVTSDAILLRCYDINGSHLLVGYKINHEAYLLAIK